MIDIAFLVKILAPALPMLLGLGQKAIEKGAEKLGEKGAEGLVKQIWQRLKPRVEAKLAALDVAKDVANTPEDPGAIASLEYQLKKILEDPENAGLKAEIAELSLEPQTVLIRFLTALTGRDESQLATNLDGLVAQYRSTLATKHALIILDNARDEAQIRDLLPSNSNCAVVVTSRSRLTGLPGAELVDLLPMAVGTDGALGEF